MITATGATAVTNAIPSHLRCCVVDEAALESDDQERNQLITSEQVRRWGGLNYEQWDVLSQGRRFFSEFSAVLFPLPDIRGE